MPDLNLMPAVRVIGAVISTLTAIDWASAGLPDMTVLPARNAHSEALNKIIVRWVEDQPRAADVENRYLTPWEMVVEMMLVLEIDVELSPEDTPDTDPAYDPTGLGLATTIAFTALRALKAEGAPLRLLADDVVDRGRGLDQEYGTPDDARFEQTISVLYRVSTEDPSVLLAMGENA